MGGGGGGREVPLTVENKSVDGYFFWNDVYHTNLKHKFGCKF